MLLIGIVSTLIIIILYLRRSSQKLNDLVHVFVAIPLCILDRLAKKKKNIEGEVVVITGAAQGIGKELSLAFNALGVKLALIDQNYDECEKLAALINSDNGQAVALKGDVCEPEQMRVLAMEIEKHPKLGPVDILVCNAGVLTANLLHKLEDDEIKKTINVNLLGYFWTIRAFLPHMLERDSGHIVSNVSMTAFIGGKYGSAYRTFPLLDMDRAMDDFLDAILLEKREVSIPGQMMYLTMLQSMLLPHRLREAVRELLFGNESIFRPPAIKNHNTNNYNT